MSFQKDAFGKCSCVPCKVKGKILTKRYISILCVFEKKTFTLILKKKNTFFLSLAQLNNSAASRYLFPIYLYLAPPCLQQCYLHTKFLHGLVPTECIRHLKAAFLQRSCIIFFFEVFQQSWRSVLKTKFISIKKK